MELSVSVPFLYNQQMLLNEYLRVNGKVEKVVVMLKFKASLVERVTHCKIVFFCS